VAYVSLVADIYPTLHVFSGYSGFLLHLKIERLLPPFPKRTSNVILGFRLKKPFPYVIIE